jgi:hypothetical protein
MKMNASPKKSRRIAISIIVASIGTLGVIIAALIGIVPSMFGSKPTEMSIATHITDKDTGASIERAKVLLFIEGNPFVEHTDTNGIATFNVNAPRNSNARLFVETDVYEIYDANIRLSRDHSIDVLLTPKGSNDRKIIVRVMDDSNNVPVDGAKVVLLATGDTYSESTDSNGLAIFTITFTTDKVEADVSVSTSKSTINRQRVTLRPDEVQDVRLNQNTKELIVTSFASSTSNPTEGTTSIAYGQLITGAITVTAQIDKYTFTGTANDVIFIKVVKTSGDLDPQIKLYTPDGKEASGFGDLDITLEVDGEYVIVINDYSGTNTGDYSLNLQKVK